MLLVVLAILSSCKSSLPPQIEICIGDGFGGADCKDQEGKTEYHSPSQLKNYWMTNEMDMQRFSSWCYGVTPTETKPAMVQISEEIKPIPILPDEEAVNDSGD